MERRRACLFLGAILVFGSFGSSDFTAAERQNPTVTVTPLSLVHTVTDLWSQLALSAAKETVKAINKGGEYKLQLDDVPLDTFQVLVGRRHQLGVEIDGITYNLLIGNEAEALQEARQRSAAAAAAAAQAASAAAAAAAAATTQALPGPSAASGAAAGALAPAVPTSALAFALQGGLGGSGGETAGPLAPLQLLGGARGRRALELPETVLMGPLELVLKQPENVGVYTPLAADVGGPVNRLLVEPGVSVRVAGLKQVALRRPVDLPRLPGQYLAEVWAQLQLGQPEEGFESAPGIMYLASRLREAAVEVATNASLKAGQQAPPPPLLSFDIETVAPGALRVTSAPELPPGLMGGAAEPAPRLRVRRQAGGTVELSLRQGQVSHVPSGGSGGAGGSPAFNAAALARTWAWPLPHAGATSWLPYESLLRSVLAAHPFNVEAVARRGIGMRLTKSSIQGVHMIAFDMMVRSRTPRPPELEGQPYEWNENQMEVWEAVVQVQPNEPEKLTRGGSSSSGSSSSSSGAGFSFVPLHVARKAAYQNTLSVSRAAQLAALTGGRNESVAGLVPGDGYDTEDLGLATNAP
ncbi:hypothetical protein HYH02_011328 [Chlamydomonas schloesseri]|uniref:Uncharacterized protein n=1 Tax=Chlamydomonas schloesseri TaxID=2026947 RepID=A0A835W4K1_9CHLO|nr:hypothetical protein HYH02_011328 [Chlamydomonas schloesseri]|eukprot:KAG2437068.1 hypothetical protein HYH02_011328 [Chlamydomonas schloesseri]